MTTWGEHRPVVDDPIRTWVRDSLMAMESAFRDRCFRLGRDRGVVCAHCDEPAVCILDRYQPGESLDWDVIVTDHRTPVCLNHAPAGTADLLAAEEA